MSIQQHLSPCKVFNGEFAKLCQHDECAGCFSHPEQKLDESSVHYVNNLYFLRINPNFIGIVCCETHERVEEVTT